MKSDDLKLILDALRALRDQMHSETNASVAAELDKVILQLEGQLKSRGPEAEVSKVRAEALRALSEGLRLVTNLAELVRIWMNSQ